MYIRYCSFFFLIVTFYVNSSSAALSLPFDVSRLKAKLENTELCSDFEASILCRGLPFLPNSDEGIMVVEGIGVVLINNISSEDTEFRKLVFGVLSARQTEVSILMLLGSEKFISSLYKTGTSSFLVLVRDVDSNKSIKEAFFTSRNALINFASSTYHKWKAELPDAIGWEPPKDFVPFYQFESF